MASETRADPEPHPAHARVALPAWTAELARRPLALAALFVLLYGFHATDVATSRA